MLVVLLVVVILVILQVVAEQEQQQVFQEVHYLTQVVAEVALKQELVQLAHAEQEEKEHNRMIHLQETQKQTLELQIVVEVAKVELVVADLQIL